LHVAGLLRAQLRTVRELPITSETGQFRMACGTASTLRLAIGLSMAVLPWVKAVYDRTLSTGWLRDQHQTYFAG
jgi:hypothetical protein